MTVATAIAIMHLPAEGFSAKPETAWTLFHRFPRWVHPSFTDAPDRSNAYSQNKLFAEWPDRASTQTPIQQSGQSPIH